MQINLKKKNGTSTGFAPMACVLTLQCSTIYAMESDTLGAGQIVEFILTSERKDTWRVALRNMIMWLQCLLNLRWLPVITNLFFKEAIMAFKCMTGMAPEYLGHKFIFRGDVSRRKTRSSQNLNIPIFKTKTGQRSFSYRTVFVNIWNNLPSEIKLSKCLNNFKCN